MLLKASLQSGQPYKAIASQWARRSLCWGFSLSLKGSPSVLASCLWPWIMWHFSLLLPSWSTLHLLLAWVARSLCLSSRWLLQHCVDGAMSPVLSSFCSELGLHLGKLAHVPALPVLTPWSDMFFTWTDQWLHSLGAQVVRFYYGPMWQRRTRKSYS